MTERQSGAERFGFRVRYVKRTPDDSPAGWEVFLPHQCMEWGISGEKYEPPVPHEQAVADLERFIAEAQEALDALRGERSYPPEPVPSP